MAEFAPTDVTPAENKRIIQSAVTPRPIAWISTVDDDGIDNLAPFSSYNYFTTGGAESTPPILLFNSPTEPKLKDTAKNALDIEEFAVNLVTEDLIEAMDNTSAELPAGKSEFDHAGVTPTGCNRIRPRRVAESTLTMECVLFETIEFYGKLMILGEVVYYHISDELIEGGKVQMENFVPVGRLGGPYYTTGTRASFKRKFR